MALGKAAGTGAPTMWNERHVATARAHLLGPWLYHELHNTSQAGLSDKTMSVLQRDYLLSSLACLERDTRLKNVLASFHRHGIRAVLLKGAYLGRVVYRDPALRPMADLDILVTEDQFERAGTLLASLGYRLQVEGLGSFHRELNPALAHVHESRPGDAVDLHRGLWLMDYYRLSSSIVRADAVESNLLEQSVYYLSLELNFIHVALHNLTHAGCLRDWLDLVMLVTRTDFHWNRLVHLAQSLGVLRPLYWVFRELSGHWGIVVPAHVKQAMEEYSPHWLEDLVIRHRLRYAWRFASRFRYIHGWPAKLAYLRVGLFPPAEYRKSVVGTSAWLPYLKAKSKLFVHLAK
jgi:hypothetical protein